MKYFLLVSLLSGSSLRASDPLIDIEKVDEQFFEQQEAAELEALAKEATEAAQALIYAADEERKARLMQEAENAAEKEVAHLREEARRAREADEAKRQAAANEPSSFPEYEYIKYMKLIKNINELTYHSLKECERKFSKPCIQKGNWKILPPTNESHGYPLLVIPSIYYQSLPTIKAHLTTMIGYYNTVLSNSQYDLPQSRYEEYMNLINEVNPPAYEALKQCAEELSKPCLKHASAGYTGNAVRPPTDASYNYPIIVMKSLKKNQDKKLELTRIAAEWYKQYEETFPITAEERIHFLTLIESLLPELYAKIIAVDPTGFNHIKRQDDKNGAGVLPSLKDGLPLILVGAELRKFPLGVQRFIIGHELGHYVLGHFKTHAAPHTTLNTEKKEPQEYASGRKIAGQLPFTLTFENAFSRVKEYEADRFSILGCGTAIDDGITYCTNQTSDNPTHSKTKTFKRTHPLFEQRIKHFESLRPEVELQKAHDESFPPIDWNALVEKYKKNSWKELEEAL